MLTPANTTIYRVFFQYELYTFVGFDSAVNWSNTKFMQDTLSETLREFTTVIKQPTIEILKLSSDVVPYNHTNWNTDVYPDNYTLSFNVCFCNALLHCRLFGLEFFKPSVVYKVPSTYIPVGTVANPLVYRFTTCIDFASTNKLRTILDGICYLSVWYSQCGVFMRNGYFSYILL